MVIPDSGVPEQGQRRHTHVAEVVMPICEALMWRFIFEAIPLDQPVTFAHGSVELCVKAVHQGASLCPREDCTRLSTPSIQALRTSMIHCESGSHASCQPSVSIGLTLAVCPLRRDHGGHQQERQPREYGVGSLI